MDLFQPSCSIIEGWLALCVVQQQHGRRRRRSEVKLLLLEDHYSIQRVHYDQAVNYCVAASVQLLNDARFEVRELDGEECVNLFWDDEVE